MASEALVPAVAAAPAAPAAVAAPQPPGTRRRKGVQYLECGVIVCWCLTASSGCFGFYLGFDTKIGDSEPLTCKKTGVNDTCSLNSGHDDICNACHRMHFDPLLILISFYQVVLGGVGLLVSCGSKYVLERFGFLRNRFGRGFLLFFIGTLAIAQGLNFTFTSILTLVVGSIDTGVGFSLMVSYVCVGSGKVYEAPGMLSSTTLSNGAGRPALLDHA